MPNTDHLAKTNGEHSATALPHPVVRQLDHPERRLTLLFIASAGLFALVGTILGTFMLAALSGVPTTFSLTLFSAHPFLQIYGFIGEFVVGVVYSLLPRFKIGRMPSLGLGYTTYLFFTSANILFLFSAALPHFISGSIAALLILVGSVTFTAQVFSLALRPTGGFPETNPLIMLSSFSLVLISLTLLLGEAGLVSTDPFSTQMIFLALLGFAYASIGSVFFRLQDWEQCLRTVTGNACSISQMLTVIFLPIEIIVFVGVLIMEPMHNEQEQK